MSRKDLSEFDEGQTLLPDRAENDAETAERIADPGSRTSAGKDGGNSGASNGNSGGKGGGADDAGEGGGQGGSGDEDMVAETEDSSARRIGMWIIAIVFGGFGLWAVIAPLDSAALAPGTVTVEAHRKALQHLEGGIVRDILVREGQVVTEGQVLLLLDDTQARAEFGIVTGQFLSAKALDDRLSSERDGLDAPRFSEALQVDDSRAREAMKNETEIFAARRDDRLGETEVLQQRVIQLESQIEGLEALVLAKQEVVTLLEEEISDLSALLDDGFADKQRLRELQRNRASTLGEIADHRASIASSQVRIGETRLEILQLNKRFITEVVDELAKAQAQVYDLQQRLSALQDTLERTTMRAPVGGIILGLNTHTIGGVIRPGDTLMEIVPQLTDLVIDARISPQDIDRVSIGAEADIRFSAFKNAYTIVGTLERVSADALLDEQSGLTYFSAQIKISDQQLARLEGLQLLPGMPAEVFINTGERTLLQYLITPASNMFARSLIEE